jgi:hypothetical protein
MISGRFETTVFTIAGVVVITKVLALFKDVVAPDLPQIQIEQQKPPTQMPRSAGPYMPDVEADEWIQEHGMPMQGGWIPMPEQR